MTFLGDIITTASRNKLYEIISAKSDEISKQMGLTKVEENMIATKMFVAVMQTEVIPYVELEDDPTV